MLLTKRENCRNKAGGSGQMLTLYYLFTRGGGGMQLDLSKTYRIQYGTKCCLLRITSVI